MAPLLRVSGLSKRFGEKQVFKDFSLILASKQTRDQRREYIILLRLEVLTIKPELCDRSFTTIRRHAETGTRDNVEEEVHSRIRCVVHRSEGKRKNVVADGPKLGPVPGERNVNLAAGGARGPRGPHSANPRGGDRPRRRGPGEEDPHPH